MPPLKPGDNLVLDLGVWFKQTIIQVSEAPPDLGVDLMAALAACEEKLVGVTERLAAIRGITDSGIACKTKIARIRQVLAG